MATGRIGVTPTLGVRWSKAPTGGTTSLSGLDDNSVSLVYSVGYEQVYRNGVLLSRGNDYTATTGTSITLIDATITGDIIEVFAQQLVPLTDAISKGQFTAKGALLSATAASTPGVLTVGSNDQVLTADSTAATGLKWATPSAGGMTLLSTTTLSGTSTTISSISSSYKNLYIIGRNITTNVNEEVYFRVNGDTGSNYTNFYLAGSTSTFLGTGISETAMPANQTGTSTAASATTDLTIEIDRYTENQTRVFYLRASGRTNQRLSQTKYDSSTAISSINFFTSGGSATFSTGTIYIYGVN